MLLQTPYNACADDSRVNLAGKNEVAEMCVNYAVKKSYTLLVHECIIDCKFFGSGKSLLATVLLPDLLCL